jgi:hypothetical protein
MIHCKDRHFDFEGNQSSWLHLLDPIAESVVDVNPIVTGQFFTACLTSTPAFLSFVVSARKS